MLNHYEREALIWASSQEATTKLILLALNGYVDGNGECWPSIDTVVKKTSLGRSTVIRKIDALAKASIVTKTIRTAADGRQTSNHYQIRFAMLKPKVEESRCDIVECQSDMGGVSQRDPGGCQGDMGEGVTAGPNLSIKNLTIKNNPKEEERKSAPKRIQVDVLKVEVVQEQTAIPLPVKEEEPTTEQTTKDQGARRVELDASAKLTKTACDRQTHALVCTARQDADYLRFKQFYSRVSNVVDGNYGNGQAAEEEWVELRASGYEIGEAFWAGMDAFKDYAIAKFKVDGKFFGFQGARNFLRDRGWEVALERQTMKAEIEASGFKPDSELKGYEKQSRDGRAALARAMAKRAAGLM